MDFTNRTNPQPAPSHAASATAAGSPAATGRHKRDGSSKWLRIGGVALLFSLTILVVAVIGILYFGGTTQDKYVNTSKYQAVFLTNGQVYFGNIKQLSNDFIRLDNIYYLTQGTTTDTSGTTTASGNYTLVKLGCQQIHDPYDEMIINNSQVSFWENLQSGGKVVQSIQQFQKQNPNGPNCSQVSTQTQASSTSGAQGGTTTGTTNTTSGSAAKP